MRTYLVLAASAMAAGLCTGCEKDFYARQIIEYNTTPGKNMLALTGPDDQLIRAKRIDSHHSFTMKDSTAIDFWIIKAHPTTGLPVRGTALLLHGLRESKADCLGAAHKLAALGYDVVLPDLRAHGHSGGKYVTYGALEKRDLKDVMDKLIGAGSIRANLYVFGTNLGAATAIQYAAIDDRCKAVLAVSPYRDAASIARRIILFAPTMNDAEFEDVLNRAGEIAGFNPQEASAESAAALVTCPMLLVYRPLDLSVPQEQVQAIYQAAKGPKRLIPAPLDMGDAWIAQQLDQLATRGLADQPAATATAPAAPAAPKPVPVAVPPPATPVAPPAPASATAPEPATTAPAPTTAPTPASVPAVKPFRLN